MSFHSEIANYQDPKHKKDLIYLLNQYALDPMGGAEPLKSEVQENLCSSLAEVPSAFSILIYSEQSPVALANCFEGFSTFKCAPLVNIHDFIVSPQHRRLGLSQLLLQEIENEAKKRKACKITLEVLGGNTVAKKAYQKFGFEGYELDPKVGGAQFWQKNFN